MGILGGAIGEVINGVFKNAEGILDTTITNKEELQQAYNELEKLKNEAEIAVLQETTKRWQADMASDNKLSKNIRPASLIFLTVVFTIISFADGNIGGFTLADGYKPIYQSLLLLAYGAYFGDRALRGYTTIKNKINDK
jgi:hypothetical protein